MYFSWKESKVRNYSQFLEIKEKNSKKIDKLKNNFQNILNTKLVEIETEAIGQIREARIKEEQAQKNLQEKSDSLKSDFMSIHEHEKIVNERMDHNGKQKKIELNSLVEKFEQELRHLKETYSLKANNDKSKAKSKIKELIDRIEVLSKTLFLTIIDMENECLKEKDIELYQLRNEQRKLKGVVQSGENKLFEAETEIQEITKIKGKILKFYIVKME